MHHVAPSLARAATIAVARAATVEVARAATVEVARAATVEVEVEVAFEVDPRQMATRRQGLKRIKKRPLSERSEFRTLPVSVPGGACSQREALTAIVGAAFFAPLFWRSKKAGRPPGRTPGYSPRQ